MSSPTYWLNVYTEKTWEEFLDHGADVTGFPDSSTGRRAKKIGSGDRLICYVKGAIRFVGILEVVSEAYRDENERIWEDRLFPWRLKVNPLVKVDLESGIPVKSLRDELSIFEDMNSPNSWTGYLQGSPRSWKQRDGEVIYRELRKKTDSTAGGGVEEKGAVNEPKTDSVTEDDEESEPQSEVEPSPSSETDSTTKHTRIQHSLLKLGASMGFDVWVARNDRSRGTDGKTFSELFDLKDELPLSFDRDTIKTIEYIDVLWLQGNSVRAAFEIESTTSVYSGLLRMSDLLAKQPNLRIPLYLVAPEDRRDKVLKEVSRPTFDNLNTPLCKVCRYISFESLQRRVEGMESAGVGLHHLNPSFLDEVSESTEPDES